MKTSLILVWTVFYLCNAIPAPESSDNISEEQATRITTSISHAIIWQLYWHDGKSLAQIRKQILSSPSTSFTLCRENSEDLYAYVDTYHWKIDLMQIGSQYYGFDVLEYQSVAHKPDDIVHLYSEDLLRHTNVLAKRDFVMNADDLSVLTFERPSEKEYRMITNTVISRLLSDGKRERIKERAIAEKVSMPLTLLIGRFSNQSPWVYYKIDGIPYIGMMLIDPVTGKFIHDEFLYMHENYREVEYANISQAIGVNGLNMTLRLDSGNDR